MIQANIFPYAILILILFGIPNDKNHQYIQSVAFFSSFENDVLRPGNVNFKPGKRCRKHTGAQ
jgi:hypothetical protein